MTYFRASHSSWYQVPVLYGWWDLATSGSIDAREQQRPRQRRPDRLRGLALQPCSSGARVRPAPFSCSQ